MPRPRQAEWKAPRQVVTVPAMLKRWKIWQLVGTVVAILSIFACATPIAAVVVGQLGSWWQNR